MPPNVTLVLLVCNSIFSLKGPSHMSKHVPCLIFFVCHSPGISYLRMFNLPSKCKLLFYMYMLGKWKWPKETPTVNRGNSDSPHRWADYHPEQILKFPKATQREFNFKRVERVRSSILNPKPIKSKIEKHHASKNT